MPCLVDLTREIRRSHLVDLRSDGSSLSSRSLSGGAPNLSYMPQPDLNHPIRMFVPWRCCPWVLLLYAEYWVPQLLSGARCGDSVRRRRLPFCI